jgi:glycerol-1-phosphatase
MSDPRRSQRVGHLVEGYGQFVVDLDGCVWLAGQPIAGAANAITRLRGAGKRVVFATNDSRRSSRALAGLLHQAGIAAATSDVVSATDAITDALAASHRDKPTFVIGSRALRDRVRASGARLVSRAGEAERAEVVVIGGGERFSYEDLRCASFAVRDGAVFLAAARDATYPKAGGLWPGTGAVLAAVECASERRAVVLGKPEPGLLEAALRRLGGGRTLVVGDRLDSDVAAAARVGIDAALVLSGTTSARQARRRPTPAALVAVAASLASLVDGELLVHPGE